MPHLSITGQASKRGLIPRLPTAEVLLADVAAWLREQHADMVLSTRLTAIPEAAVLRVALHPAAGDVTVTADDTGRVTLAASSDGVGPGYHRFVGRIAERVAVDVGVTWATDGDAFPWSDRAEVERNALTALAGVLVGAHAARSRGRPAVHLGTPEGVRFSVDGPLATGLGPRDDAWLDRAIGDPRIAIDVLPWWADAVDGRCLLNRALCLMWTLVRWRPPGTDEERAALDDVLRTMWRAYPLDPALPYPWDAWRELLDLRAGDDPAGRLVRDRSAALARGGDAPIGYRRRPVTILHEGWRLEVPGSFAERRTDEEWWGGEGGRSITVAAVETGLDGRAMRAREFLDRVAGHLGRDALTHRTEVVEGRARLATDPSSGVEVGVLDAFSAAEGRGAAIRVVFDDPADWQWAMEVWQGLEPVASSDARELARIA